MKPSSRKPSLAPSLLLLLAAGCASVAASGSDPAPEATAETQAEEAPPEKAGDSAKKRRDRLRKKQDELPGKEHALHVAQLELKIAGKKGEESAAAAEWGVEKARRLFEEAERSRETFETLERTVIEEKRDLDLSRAERRLLEEQADLEGILRIYEDEPEASAKDEIIARHRRDVEFAERSLAIARRKAELDTEREIAARTREIQLEIDSAQRALEKARAQRDQARVTVEIDLAKKERALVEAQEAAEDLRKEIQKLKKSNG